jgi:hypothetical protein
MEQKTFTGPTLEEARKAKERWLSAHKVAVRKETTATLSKPNGRFTLIAQGAQSRMLRSVLSMKT